MALRESLVRGMGNLASRIVERLVKSEFGFVNRRERLHILNQVTKIINRCCMSHVALMS